MTNPITLTAAQAAELHTKGRLTGYREKCEWQPPKYAKYKRIINGKTLRYRWLEEFHEETLTPPRDTNTTYAVKEPCMSDFGRGDARRVWFDSEADEFDLTAEEMPDWAVRQHARITDRKLIISDGELWWDFGDLEKVAE